MARTRRERLLIFVVLLSILGLGGSLAGRKMFQAWAGIDEEIENRHLYLSKLQAITQRKAGIQEAYLKTQSELTMNPSESAQIAQFSKELQTLLSNARLEYRELQQQEKPRLDEDFKVLLIDVNQARGTPDALGTFLYNLEHQSNVMYVEDLTITGEMGRRGGSGGENLTMDMRVARLVEYATGEAKPEIKRGRISPRK